MMDTDSRLTMDKCIQGIFMTLIIICVIVLSLLMLAGLACCVYSIFNHLDVNYLLKGIEFIFIAPLPLLIGSAFYKMYTKTIRRTVLDRESNVDFERDQIMVDLSITKYLFTSTIISTLLVILIEFLYGMIHSKSDSYFYPVIILGLSLLGILIYYINKISIHLDHKIKESKDNIQKRFVDFHLKRQKQREAKKEELQQDQAGINDKNAGKTTMVAHNKDLQNLDQSSNEELQSLS